MPLQRLTMDADYSERLIHPLRQRSTRNLPRAVLISSTRPTTPANSVSTFFNAPLRLPARNPPPRRDSALVDESVQARLAGYRPFHPGPTFKPKTRVRKFADFSVDGEVAMVRGIPTPISTLYPRRNIVPESVYVNDLNFVRPPRLISQLSGQPTATAPNPDAPPNPQQPATENPADLLPSSQLSDGPESNAPVTNWRQAVVSSCVVGVALVAVATGYAYSTVFRGALNVGQFVYTNREGIQKAATTCTQAVLSTYNAAKRRMVSIPVPRLPMGMRRRYATPQKPHARSWRCRLFRQSRVPVKAPVKSSQPINPVTSSLAPDGMPAVEYSGLSNKGQFPDTQDAVDPDAFIHPRSPDALASGVPFMTGELICEPTPPPLPSPSPAQDQSASVNLAGTPTPDDMELTEQPCICYAESVFSEDIEDEFVAEDGDDTKTPTTALFEDDGGMDLEEDFWFLPGQFEPSQRLTNPQAVSMSASRVIEAPTPVIEHPSPSPTPSPTIEPDSPLLSPPGAFPPPFPPSGRPTPSLPPSPKAAARQGEKSCKRKIAPGAKKPVSQKNPLPPPPRKRKASSPPKEIRRSNRIADSKK